MEASIVIPTIAPEQALKAGEMARQTAGVPCHLILACDHSRRGGIRPANAGFRAALEFGAPYIVYLNDDTAITQENWLVDLVSALETNPRYGIAGPTGRCRTGPQLTFGKSGILEVEKPLAWFCAVVKRQVFEEVGLFDSELIHYAGDSDLSMRAHKAGWKSILVLHVYVEHSPGDRIMEWWEHDIGIYGRKHR